MKWVNPPVAYMLHAGVPRLRQAGVHLPGLADGDLRRVALEAYPGLLARELLGARSYKSDEKARQTPERLIARKDLVDALEQGRSRLGLRLKLSHAQRDALVADASGDRLDAVLCACCRPAGPASSPTGGCRREWISWRGGSSAVDEPARPQRGPGCPNTKPFQSIAFAPCPRRKSHAHLEGCFEPGLLAQWAAQAKVPLPRPVEHLFEFEGLADFLHFLDWACGLASTRDRLAQLSYGYCRRLADNGAGYADVIVNPTHWPAWQGRLAEMIDAIDAGLTAAEQDGLPPVGLCVSLLRTQSADAAAELVDALVALRHPRVVALSIDGNEAAAGRTGPRFAQAFRRAGEAGLRRTVHAGESSGPEGVRDAIELLGADRIDHGVRAIEDPDLVGLLVDRQIPLGVCPTSNLTLGVYPSIESHPIDRLRRAGVAVSLNTDDPALLGASLVGEYAPLQHRLRVVGR